MSYNGKTSSNDAAQGAVESNDSATKDNVKELYKVPSEAQVMMTTNSYQAEMNLESASTMQTRSKSRLQQTTFHKKLIPKDDTDMEDLNPENCASNASKVRKRKSESQCSDNSRSSVGSGCSSTLSAATRKAMLVERIKSQKELDELERKRVKRRLSLEEEEVNRRRQLEEEEFNHKRQLEEEEFNHKWQLEEDEMRQRSIREEEELIYRQCRNALELKAELNVLNAEISSQSNIVYELDQSGADKVTGILNSSNSDDKALLHVGALITESVPAQTILHPNPTDITAPVLATPRCATCVPAANSCPVFKPETPTFKQNLSGNNTVYAPPFTSNTSLPVLETPAVHYHNAAARISASPVVFPMCLCNRLPVPMQEPQTFSGDSAEFYDFVDTFDHIFDPKIYTARQRLHYLLQYTSGPANALVVGCRHMPNDKGFDEARRLLKNTFGQNFQIAQACISPLVNGSMLYLSNKSALIEFSANLTSCMNTLKGLNYLHRMDNMDVIMKILKRIPNSWISGWDSIIDTILHGERRDVSIEDLATYIARKTRECTNFMTDLTRQLKPRMTPAKSEEYTGRLFATPVTMQLEAPKCRLCTKNHYLNQCTEFRTWDYGVRHRYVMDQRLCFSCLKPGHIARFCKRQSPCAKSNRVGKNTTLLHPPDDRAGTEEDKETFNSGCTRITTAMKNYSPTVFLKKGEKEVDRASQQYQRG